MSYRNAPFPPFFRTSHATAEKTCGSRRSVNFQRVLTKLLGALAAGYLAAMRAEKKNEQRGSLWPSDSKHGGVNALPDPSRAHVASRAALGKRAVPAHAAVEVGEASPTLAKGRELAPSPVGFQLRMHPPHSFSTLKRLATPAALPVGMKAQLRGRLQR